MVEASFWEQIGVLREMTSRTGLLHEAQVLQLKVWPRLLFPDSTKSFFSIDIPKKVIHFTITESLKPPKKQKKQAIYDREHAFGALDQNVKALLGNRWEVRVEVQKGRKVETKSFGPDFEDELVGRTGRNPGSRTV